MEEEASNEEARPEQTGSAQSGGLVLNLGCTLDAGPAEVFRMLTDPAELKTWWGPRGFTIPAADLNLTVGGRYRFRMTPPDGEPFHSPANTWRSTLPGAWSTPSGGRNRHRMTGKPSPTSHS